MTDTHRTRLRDILASLQQAGIAFAYQPHRQVPEYTVDQAILEIEKLMKETS